MRITYFTNRLLSVYDYLIKDSTLAKKVKVSTIIHIGLLICLVITPILFPARYKYNRSTIHTVQLVSLPAIRPQQSTITKPVAPTKKPVAKEPVKKTMAKPVSKPAPKPIAKPLTTPTLEEKLSKRLEKEFVEPEPIDTTASLDKQYTEPSSAPLINIGVSGPSNFPFQYYLDIIHDKISSCWYEPQMVLDKQYTAIITFTIMQDGSVQNIHIKRSSGISNFDQSGIKAVELARPFPQLPQGFPHPQLTVNVAFNLE